MNSNIQFLIQLGAIAFGCGIVYQKVNDLCKRVDKLEKAVFNRNNPKETR